MNGVAPVPVDTVMKHKMGVTMSKKLFWLTVGVLGTSVLAHAISAPNPSPSACSHVPSELVEIANTILSALGLGPVC